MTRVTAIKATAVTVLLLAAALVSLLFVFVIGGEEGGKKIGSLPLPGLSLGLTAEARAALLGNAAFPETEAGFAAILSMPPEDMDVDAVRDALLIGSPTPLSRVSGLGTLRQLGNNFFVADVSIVDLIGTVTVWLFVSQPASGDTGDTSAWVVAYFLRGTSPAANSAALSWNPIELGRERENPLTEIDRFINSDAILDVLAILRNAGLVSSAEAATLESQVSWYHFDKPSATNLLMIASSRRSIGTDTTRFGLPASAVFDEVSVFKYVTLGLNCCFPQSRLVLDGSTIIQTASNAHRKQYAFVPGFNNPPLDVHTMILAQTQSNEGSTSAVLALLYH